MKTHPIHPAFVHFPIACWSLAVLADFASLRYGHAAWQWSGGLLAVGCAMGLLAACAGVMELARVPEGAAMRDANWHMGLMLTAFCIFATRALAGLEGKDFVAPSTFAFVLDALGFATLLVGGWMGARLVYTHGIGQTGRSQRKPKNALGHG